MWAAKPGPGKNPGPSSGVGHGHLGSAHACHEMGCAGSHLFEELIHEAISVHGDCDIIIIIAVLGLRGGVHTEQTCGRTTGSRWTWALKLSGIHTQQALSLQLQHLSVFLAGTSPGCAPSSSHSETGMTPGDPAEGEALPVKLVTAPSLHPRARTPSPALLPAPSPQDWVLPAGPSP